MPKKMGTNSKAEEARARKTATETEKKERESRAKEDQYWREAEGDKPRAAKKREEEAQKRAEAAARKAEAKRLAELEEKELEKAGKKPDKKANRVAIPVPKVTEAELQRRREEEQLQILKRTEEAKKRQSRTADEEEYERMVLVSNTNRDESLIEAHSVDDALARMTVADNLSADRHPERRLKASFKAFEEAELPILKEEKPGLTHTQYKDMIWKLWKKSPDNPLNQAREKKTRNGCGCLLRHLKWEHTFTAIVTLTCLYYGEMAKGCTGEASRPMLFSDLSDILCCLICMCMQIAE
ncbi:Protein of unknown function DUF1014 [Macleaya cordata]|uniref:Coiled-coil domain-containing protein n=1 Tax=Macleaya cordata TaxID=56857 RepID=A0A200QZV3_MACCD|nr:Protein of unknown function DUF1014 [Macleaya cordata]